MVRGPVPVFVRFVVCATVVVPTCWEPNARLVGFSVTTGAAAEPVPLREIVCVPPGASSAIVTLAVRVPVAVGVNVTEIVQPALAASVDGPIGQVFDCA